MSDTIRPTLGSLMSLTCFHYLRHGAEDAAGRALVVSAGRQRGHDVAEELGLLGSMAEAEQIREKLALALGAEGTRLCLVQSVTPTANSGFEVRVAEGACTAGVTSQEPYCAFTLGVFIGAISAITGQRMIGREVECSAMSRPECVYLIEPFT
jgi:predicted hydrocarbon binding protein